MRITRYLVLIFFTLLLLPGLQRAFSLVEEGELKGDVRRASCPEFSVVSWLSGEYQSATSNCVSDQIGFFPIMIRLRNQISWSLFGEPRARKVVAGQEGYLYEEGYFRASSGQDFLGTPRLKQRLGRFKELQDSLATRGKSLVVVIAPSKANYFPEFAPAAYAHVPTDSTNYYAYTQLLPKLGLNYIDFDAWFRQLKPTSACPLMLKGGIHWSEYGMMLASDSLLRYFEVLRNIDLPDYSLVETERNTTVKGTDNDLVEGMNLIAPPTPQESCAMEMRWQEKPATDRPRLLVLGDSFYNRMVKQEWQTKAFEQSVFWYYNNQVYGSDRKVNHPTVGNDIQPYDIVMLIGNASSLEQFDWGFVGDALRTWPGQ